jgi:DNA-binding SARP family transcriptional activator
VSPSDVGLGSEVRVDLDDSRALAHRLLDADQPAPAADITATSVDALSGELLPGWYEDWALIESEEWRQLRLHALEALAHRLAEAHRYGDAVGAALAATRVDPLRESARAALIAAHLAEDNQSEALREFGRYRQLLRSELGLDPTPRLHALLGEVRTVTPR